MLSRRCKKSSSCMDLYAYSRASFKRDICMIIVSSLVQCFLGQVSLPEQLIRKYDGLRYQKLGSQKLYLEK